MSDKVIKEVKSQLDRLNELYIENKAYTNGRNPKILSKAKEKDPDERISSPWATQTTDNFCGYSAKPGNITITVERKGDRGDDEGVETLNDLWRQFEDINNDTLEIPELYREAISQGYGYEVWWTTDDEDIDGVLIAPEWKMICGTAGFPLYTNDIKPKLDSFYYFTRENDTDIVTIYKPFNNEIWTNPKDGDMWTLTEVIETPYKRVSVAKFHPNRERDSIFEAGKPLIDSYDSMISKSMNEVLRFNDSYLMLPMNVDKEFVDKLREMKVFDNLEEVEGSQWPKYIERDLNGITEFNKVLGEIIKDEYDKTSKNVDVTDEKFASGTASGIALKLKMVGMEFKAAMIEIYFNQGFADRYDLFFDIIDLTTLGYKRSDYKFVIDSKRNLPVDEKEKVEIAQLLTGIGVSKETILKILPNTLIPDVEKELEKIDEEALNNPELITDEDGELSADAISGDVEIEKDVVLNGAQIQSALKIIEAMAAGLIDRETAINQIMIFFAISREKAEMIVGKLSAKVRTQDSDI